MGPGFSEGCEIMKSHLSAVIGAAALAGLAIACSSTPTTPSPSAAGTAGAGLAADGSNLKVSAPSPTSPINDFVVEDEPTLIATASTGTYATAQGLQYEFEVYNDASVKVVSATVSSPSYKVTSSLEFDKRHTWRVRGVLPAQGGIGPWSTVASFKSPAGGYIKNQELFDPLTNGKTVGTTIDVTFTAGGVRLNSKDSVVQYRIPQALTSGEFSAIITNLGNGSEQFKPKVMSMLDDDGVNTTDNKYRVTIDKRSTFNGFPSPVRFTFCVRPDCSEQSSGPQDWNRSHVYFWKFTWGNGVARLRVLDGGTNGTEVAHISGTYEGVWNPGKMLVRLGSIGGRAENETNPGSIIRNVWVSARPRPAFKGDQ